MSSTTKFDVWYYEDHDWDRIKYFLGSFDSLEETKEKIQKFKTSHSEVTIRTTRIETEELGDPTT